MGSGESHLALDRPSVWVARFARWIPAGEVLDVACGGGRHARLLASLGHTVIAVDRDGEALARAAGPGIVPVQADLESGPDGAQWPFASRRFTGIVVTNYLHRPLFPRLWESLVPGGVLVYETFAQGNERFGKPSNPAFLLAPGELLRHLARDGAHVLAYEDGYVTQPKPAMVQRICVIKAAVRGAPEAFALD
ncbi:class I SAM-dependent methyltransferase [Oxalobacteraceae bacterium OM1]|nr:class I SAM-dependent methyltransferase [Oxalobacteraceae bacterium OM1]